MTAADIMVVEDERIVAHNLQNELVSLGYRVPAVASSGKEALEKIEQTWPDLVLMDIVLKGDMDGIEVSDEIRDRYDIPVVYLTAYADDATLKRAKMTDPYGYLVKPYEEKELRTTIELALFKHRLQGISRDMRLWLSAILRSIADGVMVMDREGCIRISNGAAQKLTGWPEDEAFGCQLSKVFRLLDAKTRVALNCPAADAMRVRRPVHLDPNALLIARDGQEVRVEGNIAAIVGSSLTSSSAMPQ